MAASAAALSNTSVNTPKADSTVGLFTSISALPSHERQILDRFLAELGPQPGVRPEIADVLTRWALLRYRIDKCQRLEFACQHQLAVQFCQANEIDFPTDPMDIAHIEAIAFIDDQKGAKVLTRLHSYEARLLRDLHRTIKEYNDLMAREEPQARSSDLDLASFFQTPLEPQSTQPEIARNTPCPCGSGLKYKRCCGKGAPPQLHHAA